MSLGLASLAHRSEIAAPSCVHCLTTDLEPQLHAAPRSKLPTVVSLGPGLRVRLLLAMQPNLIISVLQRVPQDALHIPYVIHAPDAKALKNTEFLHSEAPRSVLLKALRCAHLFQRTAWGKHA
eukprot:4750739-Amphidinium_carterae.2